MQPRTSRENGRETDAIPLSAMRPRVYNRRSTTLRAQAGRYQSNGSKDPTSSRCGKDKASQTHQKTQPSSEGEVFTHPHLTNPYKQPPQAVYTLVDFFIRYTSRTRIMESYPEPDSRVNPDITTTFEPAGRC